MVSAGSEEANKEMELTSPVLLDQQFAAGRAFGASGTPSAVLVDAEGKLASPRDRAETSASPGPTQEAPGRGQPAAGT